ncbi:MAG: carboxynorspermidine decarboxylase [Methylococcaceae bacterium]|nr:carboxynorspermidine decarboxylase [Methylococcaceae bacterium]
MPMQQLKQFIPSSPAFLLDQQSVLHNLQDLAELKKLSGCKVLYSLKALPLASVMHWVKNTVEGFSVSSLYEARLAYEILAGTGSIHLTTPGLRAEEMAELMRLCSHISFNSLNQWQRFSGIAPQPLSLGLRVNPKLSFASDVRFDPCRPHSKLGVDIQDLCDQDIFKQLQGLHFHTVFSATDFEPLLKTVATIREHLGSHFATLQWLNLGGGYLFSQINDHRPFIELVKQLRQEFGLAVYIEPGKAILEQAGYLISSVIDCFNSDGKQIVVLDTSINHHPEVFEYQRQPDLIEHQAGGRYSATLVGSTCLAGDIFGDYHFEQPLNIGDRVVFNNVGAYTLIKANRFNGYPLPDIYAYSNQQLIPLKYDSYEAYRQQWFV